MIVSNPIPHLAVDGAERAIAFYEAAFGAKCEDTHAAEDGRLMHARLSIGSGALLLHDDFPEFGEVGGVKAPDRLGGTSMTVHLDSDKPDALWERATKAGAEIVMPLDDQFWGQRYGKLRDPFGHVWSIGGSVKQ